MVPAIQYFWHSLVLYLLCFPVSRISYKIQNICLCFFCFNNFYARWSLRTFFGVILTNFFLFPVCPFSVCILYDCQNTFLPVCLYFCLSLLWQFVLVLWSKGLGSAINPCFRFGSVTHTLITYTDILILKKIVCCCCLSCDCGH